MAAKLGPAHFRSLPNRTISDRMNTEDVLDEFRGAGALREGHFILASGRHSPVFLQ
ncbi:MAG: pyrE, partial [Phenylobacterium sp.]|nr:pyrE [Phenylobacterium sp.]